MGADMRRSGATFSLWWFDRLVVGIAVHRPSNKSTERQGSHLNWGNYVFLLFLSHFIITYSHGFLAFHTCKYGQHDYTHAIRNIIRWELCICTLVLFAHIVWDAMYQRFL
jgi:hypothetical protein